jgi:4-hydroxybenzoate polyprenyltransferase
MNLTPSPTGEPRMRPQRVPFWLVLGVTLAAGFTAAGQMLPEHYELARVLCTVAGVAIGAGLGVASPGLRKP